MKLGVLSDVHGNLVALDAVLEDGHGSVPHLSTRKTDIRPPTSSA